MAMTKVYLIQVPLENDYKHTLYFESKAAQQSYFQGRITAANSFSGDKFTYQRKDEKIRINAQYDSIINCNYCMYQNAAYNNKWFYAFITDIKYISDGVTEVYIETDVMQTWFFDYALKQCFVEREHTKDDTIGANTVPEGLETGSYICAGQTGYDGGLTDYVYVLASTLDYLVVDANADGYAKFATAGNKTYNGVYSGVGYFVFDKGETANTVISVFSNNGVLDAVQCLFMAPKVLAPLDTEASTRQVKSSTLPYTQDFRIEKQYLDNTITGIKNNKLKTYPYCYLVASNLQGGEAIYKYEDFANEWCNFHLTGALTPGCSVRMTPKYYKGSDSKEVDIEGLNLAKFPICNFQGDVYTNWLTQNSANIAVAQDTGALSVAAGALSTVAGVAAAATGVGAMAGVSMIGGGVLSTMNGINQIKSNLASIEQQSFTPPQARGNLNSGDVMAADEKIKFMFYAMSIKPEYAKIIDDYFTMYGYQTNRVKVPNTNHRSRFWYTKTVGCEIDGAMAQKDIQKIKACYDNGITFWRDAADIAIYNTANTIL